MEEVSRFWSRVSSPEEPKGCRLWTGASFADGYGSFYVGTGRHDQRMVRAHRKAFELTFGPIPDGLLVLHHCDQPLCCNPDHLYVGTQRDNARDAVDRRRTRGPYGSLKLDREIADQIRVSAANGISQRDLAARFGVSKGTIYYVLRGRWATATRS